MTNWFHNATHMCRPSTVVAAVLLTAVGARAQEPIWDNAPTKIDALLALDVPGGAAESLAVSLPKYLSERSVAAVGPAWNLKAQVVTGALRQQLLKQLASPDDKLPDDFPKDGDKLLLLSVRRTVDGYELTGREYDRLVERWGPLVSRECRQQQAVAEQLFEIAWQVVAPVTRFEVDTKDKNRVVLRPRGGTFPLAGSDMAWARPGRCIPAAVASHHPRRRAHEGRHRRSALDVHRSHRSRRRQDCRPRTQWQPRPFGGRRRGRVEEVAIALRADPANTVLMLRSRVKAEKPLVGYEVFAKNTDGESIYVARRKRHRRQDRSPARQNSPAASLSQERRPAARPTAGRARAVPLVEAPLPDDDARLEAEAQLAAMREDLVDVVVRRNILMARTRQKIEKKDWKQAQELIRVLDDLPGRTQFDLELAKQARLVRSDDPQIQKRIDRLVEGMQAVLGKFLDNRPINELHDELRAAQRAAAESQKTPDNQAPKRRTSRQQCRGPEQRIPPTATRHCRPPAAARRNPNGAARARPPATCLPSRTPSTPCPAKSGSGFPAVRRRFDVVEHVTTPSLPCAAGGGGGAGASPRNRIPEPADPASAINRVACSSHHGRSSSTTAAAVGVRVSGFLSIIAAIASQNPSGKSGLKCSGLSGISSKCRRILSAVLPPGNGTLPVTA